MPRAFPARTRRAPPRKCHAAHGYGDRLMGRIPSSIAGHVGDNGRHARALAPSPVEPLLRDPLQERAIRLAGGDHPAAVRHDTGAVLLVPDAIELESDAREPVAEDVE